MAIEGQLDIFGNETERDHEYKAFTQKFEPKKTTDDCYTPKPVYEAVAAWVAKEYGVKRADFVRPFWPGGDYQKYDYPPGLPVVDNPPFSILAQIIRFYTANDIKFFLFAPTLTLFSAHDCDVTYLPVGVKITYENGAVVNSSFVTNMDGEYRIRTSPALYRAVNAANTANLRAQTKQLPKYSYPDYVVTAANAYLYSKYGIDFRVRKAECLRICALDAQAAKGKAIFGGGYLLSKRAAAKRAAAEHAAAKRAAAERAAAWIWTISDREYAIIRRLSGEEGGGLA